MDISNWPVCGNCDNRMSPVDAVMGAVCGRCCKYGHMLATGALSQAEYERSIRNRRTIARKIEARVLPAGCAS